MRNVIILKGSLFYIYLQNVNNMKQTISKRAMQEFYQNIGKLFYAVAAADNVVRPEEVKALKEIVENEWVKVEKTRDEYGTDAAYQIEIIFDWLDENQPGATKAFEEFKEFKKENEEMFNKELKQLIWKTADAIAASFAGRNKAELTMLTEIKRIL